MRIHEIMSPTVHTVRPDLPAEDAWNLMRLKGVHHLVVTEGSSLRGVLSDRDAGGRSGASLRKAVTVGDLMTAKVVSVAPDATVKQAANVMRGRSIGCLVVTRKQRIVGIVTVSDLLALLGRGADRVVSTPRRVLRHRAPHKKGHSATGVW